VSKYEDLTLLVALASILIAGWALLYSRRGVKTAQGAYQLALEQDQRRKPRLDPYLAEAWTWLSSGGTRQFALLVTLSNPTETNSSLTRAELCVTLRTPLSDHLSYIVRLPIDENAMADQEKRGVILAPGVAIQAHGSIAGWLTFSLPAALREGRALDAISVSLEDSHGLSITIDQNKPKRSGV
jgi:cbb3-type cytochrome oxidase subunit 3